MEVDIKKVIDPNKYQVGVMVARFQVDELHPGHIAMIDVVSENHNKVIVFLGVSNVPNTKKNPLDFATRRAMVQEQMPDAIILPIKDNRSDEAWSANLDMLINLTFGEVNALLYGSRDSFIPHYRGRHTTTELTSDFDFSGTEVRNKISRELRDTRDFRAGIIHANYARRAVTYSTVDVVMHDGEGKILLARKPNEEDLRFIGGFVDRTDTSFEHSARREFMEETGGNAEIGKLKYVASAQIDDWRYRKEEDGIMTTLFIGGHSWGPLKPSDDIAELKWVDISDLDTEEKIERKIMPEHRGLMLSLIKKIKDGTLGIKSLEEQLNPVEHEA